MANKRADELAKNLDNENVQTFLDLISAAEGTTGNGYRTAFGGGLLPGLADHPREAKTFKQTDGKTNKTTAAGRYQFLESTWDDVAKRLGLTDFGEYSQDLGALELLRRAGALEAVKSGDFATALKKSGSTWASLPSSPYPQPTRSAEWVEQFLAANALEKQAEAQQQPAGSPPPALVASAAPVTEADLPIQQVAMAGQASPQFNAGVPSGDLLQNLSQAPTEIQTPMSWLTRLQEVQEGPTLEAESGLESWEEQLLAQAMMDDGDVARDEAVSSFFGQPATPNVKLPKQLERTINRLIASL